MEERKCHICNRPGHLARAYPEKGKPIVAGVSSARPQQRAILDQQMACRVGEEGSFKMPKKNCKPAPRRVAFGVVPIIHKVPQGVAKRERSDFNRYAILCEDAPFQGHPRSAFSKETVNSQREGRENPKEQDT